MIPILEAIQKVTPSNGLSGQTSLQLTQQENRFLDSLGGPRLLHCADEVIRGILATGLLKLGLKYENADKVVLNAAIIEIKKQYGGLRVKELTLAFDMASRLELDFEPNTYQNFSILYLNRLMNSYLRWSVQAYEQLRPDGDRENETEVQRYDHYTHRIMSDNAIRGEIQRGYEDYLAGVITHYGYIPHEWYRVLILDGFIENDKEAGIKHRTKFSQLSDEQKASLVKSQQYVWQLFELASKMKQKNLYTKEWAS
jgi:hypothetical protein